MVWNPPKLFSDHAILTAAELNTYVRDNFLELAPAKATTENGYFISNGINSIVERVPKSDFIITAEDEFGGGTGTLEFIDLATPGPTVTLETGSKVLVILSAQVKAEGVGRGWMSFRITGATDRPYTTDDNDQALIQGQSDGGPMQYSKFIFVENLIPGSNTFTAQYRYSDVEPSWNSRRITVIPF